MFPHASSGGDAVADTRSVNSSVAISSLLPDPRSISLAAAGFNGASNRAAKLGAQHADTPVAGLEDDVSKVDGTEFRDLNRAVVMVEILGVRDRSDAAARRRGALQALAAALLDKPGQRSEVHLRGGAGVDFHGDLPSGDAKVLKRTAVEGYDPLADFASARVVIMPRAHPADDLVSGAPVG